METHFADRNIKAITRQLERIQQDHGAAKILLTWRNCSHPKDDWQPCAVFMEYPVEGHTGHLGDKSQALQDA